MSNKNIKCINRKELLFEHKLDDGTVVKLNPIVTRIVFFDKKK